MIWRMVTGTIFTQVEHLTEVSGRWISNTVKVRRPGLIIQTLLALFSKAKSTERVFLSFQTALFTKVNTRKMTFRVKAYTFGLMVALTMDSGIKTKCMDKVNLPGQMEENT